MAYSGLLREKFPNLQPEVDDLFLLEPHQIADLPGRAPARELAAVLHADSRLYRFLVARHPPIEEFLSQLLAEHAPVGPTGLLACEDELVWELADWIVYQRDPTGYDNRMKSVGDLAAITDWEPLEGRVVLDAGAGTGRVSFAVASSAKHVFALEPVANLRRFIRTKAARLGIANLFVLDGFLHDIPLPEDTVDLLVTRQAIGWKFNEELEEIERVVRPGGAAIHILAVPHPLPPNERIHQGLLGKGYRAGSYQEGDAANCTFWKRIADA